MALSVPQWGVFEQAFSGPSDGNPFTEQWIRLVAESPSERIQTEGFYDVSGVYRVRCMPSFPQRYTCTVTASFLTQPWTGCFDVTEPQQGNHGMVHVANRFHFAYQDGKPMYPVGTTAYVWHLQDPAIQRATLKALASAPFNKIRFCVFPKHYEYNLGEPIAYPFEGTPMDSSVLNERNFQEYTGRTEGNHFDGTRFNPSYFRHIEECIRKLGELGIESDLILFHPYDRWGFSQMGRVADERYLRYVVARFASFHNVWWSLANEYDQLPAKTIDDWEYLASVLVRFDPYHHLRSIHNCGPFYDHGKEWITHCSIQRQDVYRTAENTDQWRERYQKPVVLDEMGYEGNIEHGWGNLSAKELVRRFWEATCRGGYGGHGETYLKKDGILWWSHGGVLQRESTPRIAFLCKVLEDIPGNGLSHVPARWDDVCAVVDGEADAGPKPYSLWYYGFQRPSFRDFHIDDVTWYHVDVIDTWNMTITDGGIHQGRFRVPLPGREYMAVRLRKKEEGSRKP